MAAMWLERRVKNKVEKWRKTEALLYSICDWNIFFTIKLYLLDCEKVHTFEIFIKVITKYSINKGNFWSFAILIGTDDYIFDGQYELAVPQKYYLTSSSVGPLINTISLSSRLHVGNFKKNKFIFWDIY